ncbi:MAG: hypothetical protein RR942_11740, partial [Romboutsia sp.]
EKKDIRNILEKINISKVLLTSLLSVGILLAISLIIKIIIGIYFPEISNIVNPLHIIMVLNIGSLSGYSSTMLGAGSVNIDIGILVLLIAPIISITISNVIVMRKENKNLNSVLLNSLGVGIFYGLILSIISIFATIKSNPMDMMEYGFSLNFRYNLFEILINGFFIGFLCSYIFGFKRKYKNDNMYLNIFKDAVNTVGIGYISVFIILLILSMSNSSLLNELGIYGYIGKINIGVILTQLSAYIWEFANMIPITINNNIISIINLLNEDMFFNTRLIFFAMIALSLLVILITGCNIRDKYSENGKKAILIFAISYSMLMVILSIFSNIRLEGSIDMFKMNNYQTSIFMGTNTVPTMVISFVYSYFISWIGYKLKKI